MTGDVPVADKPEGAAQAKEDKDRQKVDWAKDPEQLETVNEERRDRRRRHRKDPDVSEGFVQFPPRFRGEYEGAQGQRETRR